MSLSLVLPVEDVWLVSCRGEAWTVLRVELRIPSSVAGDQRILRRLDKHRLSLVPLVVPNHDVSLDLKKFRSLVATMN